MSSGGARSGAGRPRGPGYKGGRAKGTPNKVNQRRVEVAAKQGHLPGEIMLTAARNLFALAARYQPVATNPQANEVLYAGYIERAAAVASKAAPYYHQRLSALTLRVQPVDLTRLGLDDLDQLERLVSAAANADGDQAGEGPTIN